MSNDFERRVLGALGELKNDLSEVRTDVQYLKKNVGRAMVEAYQDGMKRGGGDVPPPPAGKRRFKILPGGMAAAAGIGMAARGVTHHPTATVAAIAILGMGALILFRPNPDTAERIVAGPTATVTQALPRNTQAATQTAAPPPTPGTQTTEDREDVSQPEPTDAMDVAGVEDETANEPEASGRPPIDQPTVTRTKTRSKPAETVTSTRPADDPTLQPEQRCVARAKVLGISVKLLCT